MEPYLRDDVVFYDHQIDGVRTLMRWKNWLLADEMGLGKSLQALTVFCGDVITGKGSTAIIICPVSLRSNWADEIKKFTRIPCLLLGEEINPKTGKLRSVGPAGRSEQLKDFSTWNTAKILVLNYEQVAPHIDELNALKFHVGIFDEAHMIKNPTAKRTKAFLSLKTNRSFILTGSPVMNQVHELWPMLNRISPSHFPNYHRFKNRYCLFGGFEGRQIVGTKNIKELHAVLEKVMLRRLKKDCLDLPEVQILQIPVDLHPEQRKLYERIEDDLILEDGHGNVEVVNNAMTVMLRLKQVCGTPACFDLPDDSYKLDRVVEDILELQASGEKVIVFSQFRKVLQCVVDRLESAGIGAFHLNGDVKQIDRQPMIHAWSADPTNRPICAMLQVAGVGLNMVAARYVMFVDKLWVPKLNQQAIDRAHRIGQSSTQPVQVREYIAKGTVERRIEQILRMKDKVFDSVIEDVGIVRRLLAALREDE
jgi:SNF2 family DNA or RNA helicase